MSFVFTPMPFIFEVYNVFVAWPCYSRDAIGDAKQKRNVHTGVNVKVVSTIAFCCAIIRMHALPRRHATIAVLLDGDG